MSTKSSAPGSAVLAKELNINCMKFTPSRRPIPSPQDVYGVEVVYPYSIDRGGKVVVVASLPETDRPENFAGESCLAFDVGDCVDGKKLWGCSDKVPGKPCFGTSEGKSGRHSRQDVVVKGKLCYAVCVSSWSGENIDPHPLEQLKKKNELTF